MSKAWRSKRRWRVCARSIGNVFKRTSSWSFRPAYWRKHQPSMCSLAVRRQIWQILGTDYLVLVVLASATGIVLALVASWALAVFVFNLDYTPTFEPVVIAGLIVSSLTVVIGLLTSYGIGSTPPLAILRN